MPSLTPKVFGWLFLHFKLLVSILKFGKVRMKIRTFSEKLANFFAVGTHLALRLELQGSSAPAAYRIVVEIKRLPPAGGQLLPIMIGWGWGPAFAYL